MESLGDGKIGIYARGGTACAEDAHLTEAVDKRPVGEDVLVVHGLVVISDEVVGVGIALGLSVFKSGQEADVMLAEAAVVVGLCAEGVESAV